jgi:hypothetical protein
LLSVGLISFHSPFLISLFNVTNEKILLVLYNTQKEI